MRADLNDDDHERTFQVVKKGLFKPVKCRLFIPILTSEGASVDADGYFDTDKEKVDFLFFGLVIGHEIELGYFSLAELEEVRGPLGLPIERDEWFQPKILGQLMEEHEHRR